MDRIYLKRLQKNATQHEFTGKEHCSLCYRRIQSPEQLGIFSKGDAVCSVCSGGSHGPSH